MLDLKETTEQSIMKTQISNKNNALNNILDNKKKISCLIVVVLSTIAGTTLKQIHGKLFIENLSEELDKKKEEERENFNKEIEEKVREVELEWLKEKLANEYENKLSQIKIHISWDGLNKEEREQLLGTDKKWSEE